MRFTVGGRPLDLTHEHVLAKMKGVEQEAIREHLVEIGGAVYPPKQVLAEVTQWDRTSYTTMEAQRVLTRLGFVCRRAGALPDGKPAWMALETLPDDEPDVETRLAAIEAAVATVQAAIAGFHTRLAALEARS